MQFLTQFLPRVFMLNGCFIRRSSSSPTSHPIGQTLRISRCGRPAWNERQLSVNSLSYATGLVLVFLIMLTAAKAETIVVNDTFGSTSTTSPEGLPIGIDAWSFWHANAAGSPWRVTKLEEAASGPRYISGEALQNRSATSTGTSAFRSFASVTLANNGDFLRLSLDFRALAPNGINTGTISINLAKLGKAFVSSSFGDGSNPLMGKPFIGYSQPIAKPGDRSYSHGKTWRAKAGSVMAGAWAGIGAGFDHRLILTLKRIQNTLEISGSITEGDGSTTMLATATIATSNYTFDALRLAVPGLSDKPWGQFVYFDNISITTNVVIPGSAWEAIARPANIAPHARVTASSWLENMTPDKLVDGNAQFVWRKAGWRSGMRRTASQSTYDEFVIFDFGRTEPSLISGVEILGARRAIGLSVDVLDADGSWRQVAERFESDKSTARVNFEETYAQSIRLRPTRGHPYMWGEVRILGRLRGEALGGPPEQGILLTAAQPIVDQGAPLVVRLQQLSSVLPPENQHHSFKVSASLALPYGEETLCTVNIPAEEGRELVLNFGPQPAGAYRVEVLLQDAASETIVARARLNAGVRDPAWARGEIAEFSKFQDAFKGTFPSRARFYRSVDVNGLDSFHRLTDFDYLVGEADKIGAVPEFHLNWRSLEPLPGVYDFDFADRIFSATARRGVFFKFALNPPLTGYVPDFLKDHLIETRSNDGSRKTMDRVSLASPLVREHAQRLFELLFRRYGHHPASLMWVLNVNGEYLWHVTGTHYADVSEWSMTAFRRWLEQKEKTITRLNAKWGTTYPSFEAIDPPDMRNTPVWRDFCGFMLEQTVDFYRPIAESARRLTHDGTILLLTAGHLTAEPVISLARKYDIWQSNHAQENPHFLGWAEIWRSLGVTRFGEPGFVNVDPLSVNRAFFINAIAGGRMYTYRQYGWPNDHAWQSFAQQQQIGELLASAEPMRVPVTLVSAWEAALSRPSNTFAVGATWNSTGAFYDALLKRGAMAGYYNGQNPESLTEARLIVELGSRVLPEAIIDALEQSVKQGASLKLMPSGPRQPWAPRPNVGTAERDVLWSRLGFTSNGPTRLQLGKGSAELVERRPPYRTVAGNNLRGVKGSGWNVENTSPELLEQLDTWIKEVGAEWPFHFESDAVHTWVCGFKTEDGRRFILLYNNEAERSVTARISKLSRLAFPSPTYRVMQHTLQGTTEADRWQRRGEDAGMLVATVLPRNIVLIEMIPNSHADHVSSPMVRLP